LLVLTKSILQLPLQLVVVTDPDPISSKFCKMRSIYSKRITHKYLCPLMPPIGLLMDLQPPGFEALLVEARHVHVNVTTVVM
jgi:hypothetical protein